MQIALACQPGPQSLCTTGPSRFPPWCWFYSANRGLVLQQLIYTQQLLTFNISYTITVLKGLPLLCL